MPLAKIHTPRICRDVAYSKEEKILFQNLKNFGGGMGVGSGSNLTLKFFDIFEIVKYVAFRENSDSSRSFYIEASHIDKFHLLEKKFQKNFFSVSNYTKTVKN